MGAFDYFKVCVTKKYANFEGRARRSEYWYFYLFYMIFFIPIYALTLSSLFLEGGTSLSIPVSILLLVFICALLVPSLAVSVRRLHDVGKSGWMFLLGIIPIVGPIILLVWFCTDSQPGSNKWGPNPKALNTNDDIIDQLV